MVVLGSEMAWGQTEITALSQITDADGNYIITADISGGAPGVTTFNGTLEAAINPETKMPYRISGLSAPLFATLTGTVKNIVLEDVTISGNTGNTGAIACTANGAARIYNVGILSGSVGGTAYTGGLVGFLDETARVINCYSYATITGGTDVGGIVGYNNATTTAGNINTMVMNCMFYGDITAGNKVSPIYGGKKINNLNNGKNDETETSGLNTFNYYAYDKATAFRGIADSKKSYNCALAVEEKYLNRFEFYRLLLNSNKELAAIYATGDAANADQMAKWVLETADRTISNPKLYPILKAQDKYPSIINIDAENAPQLILENDKPKEEDRNKGGKLGELSVTISSSKTDGGQSWPTGASITTSSLTLQRTDKDFDHFNYNYDKVQLPYYNDVGTGNYTDNRVVTGWKITAITAVDDDPYTTANYNYEKTYLDNPEYFDDPNYNFADRKSSNKDKYSVSGRVFSQGAYFDVPYGVTSITIEPYWGKAVYVTDKNYDVVYKNDYSNKQLVTYLGTHRTTFNNQTVSNSISTNSFAEGSSVYDNAVVLVGNLHLDGVPSNGKKAFTMMSVDEDNDHEPDYSLIYHHKGRLNMCPIRFDFLNVIGTAQAQKPDGANNICNMTICKTRGWFEITNTALTYFSQFEYENLGNSNSSDNKDKVDAPLILLGGVFDQFVSTQQDEVKGKVIYIHVGSNVWLHEFNMGTHSDGNYSTPHVPVSVTGGDFDSFYLTGTYNSNAAVRDDNAECYISGGRFGEMAGAGQEQIGNTNSANNGNVRWQIYDADITNFFGGGINDAKPVQGQITTDIFNSHVTTFCGGPKFGNMASGKTVTTNAEGCTFGMYFGAGYGGNSFSRKKYTDLTSVNWNTWAGYYTGEKGKFYDGSSTACSQDYEGGKLKNYGKKGLGVAVDFDYEFFVWSSGATGGRFFVKFVSFSLATCNDVSSSLKGCTVEENFYGGGNLGKVTGTATSELVDCTVTGSVFGAGYSATLPTIPVRTAGFIKNPNYNKSSGMFEPGDYSGTEEYTWKQVNSYPSEGGAGFDGTQVITTQNISPTNLGSVGSVVLKIKGTTEVGGSVYGGGEESGVDGNTEVTVTGGTIGTTGSGGAEYGNVYGGGKGKADDVAAGLVKGSTNVSISGSPTILHNVYGGGAYGSVGTFSYDATTGFPTNWTTTDNKGKCTVSITGGTIGSNGDNNGMVFGSSRGLEGDPEINDLVDKMAWVYDTDVTIGTQESETGPSIRGSVYGGGENGHNFNDAKVTVHSGTIGIAEGSPITDNRETPEDESDDITYYGARYPNRGNVYGSGCGTDIYTGTDGKKYFDFFAGIVCGNTTVLIDGGHVVHNVYGGGAMGSVGTYTLDDNGKPTSCAVGTGTCTVTVSGGQIGVAGATMAGHGTGGPDDFGHVFGAGRGEMHDPNEYPNVETCAYFNKTVLTISGTAFLTGSAYGGSESGHVLGDTEVTISGGQIGCGKDAEEPFDDEVWAEDYTPTDDENLDCDSWPFESPFAPYDPFANATGNPDEYSNGESTEGGRLEASDGHTYYGNVFGGGSGSIPYFDTEERISKYLSTAGTVEGNTTVTITGGHILTNVYGGCEATNVLGSATITMTGGTVGVPRTVGNIVDHPLTGYIFGAGKGDQRIFFNKETNVDRAFVTVEGGRVYGSVYGGGEDGHVLQNVTLTIGKTGEDGPTIGTKGISYFDGNVFGGGRGFGGEALTAGNVGGSIDLKIYSGKILGSVYGGGRLASVGYGLYLVEEEIEEDGQTIKPYGVLRPDDKYDGSYPDPSTEPASTYYNKGRGYITIDISGGTIGNDYEYIYNPTATQKAAIPNTTFDYQNHLQYTKGGNVFAAGMGRLYALDGTTLLDLWPKLGKCKQVILNMTGGTVKSSVYGGAELGVVGKDLTGAGGTATVNITGGTVGTKVVNKNDATEYYYFGSVFGGGKGSTANVEGISEAGTTEGNVAVNLNEDVAPNKKGAVVYQVFGCNDMNGSPKGTVTVHIHATQNEDKTQIGNTSGDSPVTDAKRKGFYDVQAVYGGGNLAAYKPTDLNAGTTLVIIDGCELTSIRTVYGGGNAASTPATNVVVNGTYEIFELFGGGNGYDKLPDGSDNPGANVGFYDYSAVESTYPTKESRQQPGFTSKYVYGSGKASVNIYGGTVHRVFGGSNTKGNVRMTAVTMLEDAESCEFCVDEAYGGGKSAPMDAEAKLLMSCIPGLSAAYGGAEAADIMGDVTLNITNGTFDRVFGGNNLSGTISGSITVNIEETGCKPVIIGELYGGGNEAAYSVFGYKNKGTADNPVYTVRMNKDDGTAVSTPNIPYSDNQFYADPQVNVKSFTSIGEIYGGGLGEEATMVGNPIVDINVANGNFYNDNKSVVDEGSKTPGNYPIPSHAKDKIGAINNVFGGGNAAEVVGNTNVNIGTADNVYVTKSFMAGASVAGYYVLKGTGTAADPYHYEETGADEVAVEGTTYYEKKEVLGADIRENVYGGGNNAKVTGNTNVVIGKAEE